MFKTTNKEAITLISQGQIMDLATVFFPYSGALNSQARRVWGNKNIDSSFLLDSEKIPSSLVKRSWSIRVFNSISGTSTTCIKCTPPLLQQHCKSRELKQCKTARTWLGIPTSAQVCDWEHVHPSPWPASWTGCHLSNWIRGQRAGVRRCFFSSCLLAVSVCQYWP